MAGTITATATGAAAPRTKSNESGSAAGDGKLSIAPDNRLRADANSERSRGRPVGEQSQGAAAVAGGRPSGGATSAGRNDKRVDEHEPAGQEGLGRRGIWMGDGSELLHSSAAVAAALAAAEAVEGEQKRDPLWQYRAQVIDVVVALSCVSMKC